MRPRDLPVRSVFATLAPLLVVVVAMHLGTGITLARLASQGGPALSPAEASAAYDLAIDSDELGGILDRTDYIELTFEPATEPIELDPDSVAERPVYVKGDHLVGYEEGPNGLRIAAVRVWLAESGDGEALAAAPQQDTVLSLQDADGNEIPGVVDYVMTATVFVDVGGQHVVNATQSTYYELVSGELWAMYWNGTGESTTVQIDGDGTDSPGSSTSSIQFADHCIPEEACGGVVSTLCGTAMTVCASPALPSRYKLVCEAIEALGCQVSAERLCRSLHCPPSCPQLGLGCPQVQFCPRHPTFTPQPTYTPYPGGWPTGEPYPTPVPTDTPVVAPNCPDQYPPEVCETCALANQNGQSSFLGCRKCCIRCQHEPDPLLRAQFCQALDQYCSGEVCYEDHCIRLDKEFSCEWLSYPFTPEPQPSPEPSPVPSPPPYPADAFDWRRLAPYLFDTLK